MGIRRDDSDVVRRLVELRRSIEEMNTAQPIGSNQVVMYPYENPETWDITLNTNLSGGAPGSPGWNVAMVTATALESDDLVADLAVVFSIVMPMGGDWIAVPQPASQGRRAQWWVPVFNTLGSSVSIKAQVIANTPVSITVAGAA